MRKLPVIGILGGIGSGKSFISRLFADLGCAVIDADHLAHEVLMLPEVRDQVKQIFGAGVLNDDGTVNRRQLAEKVFQDSYLLNILNDLVHPRVIEKAEALIRFYQENQSCKAIVLDIPLLVEVGWENRCDFLVFVECSVENRLRRLATGRDIDENQLKKRENFQISLDKKAKIAHYRINNNSDESEVAEQVAQVFSSITSCK